MKFKYDMQTLGWMQAFEKITRARVKDCFVLQDKVCFVVEQGNLFKALGQNKKNIVKIEELLKRRVKIIEYDSNPLKFVANVLAPLRVSDIKEDNGIVTITGPDQKTKGLMIGARAANLRNFESIVQKFFPEIKELKVI